MESAQEIEQEQKPANEVLSRILSSAGSAITNWTKKLIAAWRDPDSRQILLDRWGITFVIIYWELVLKLLTGSSIFPAIFFIVPFSAAIGQILYALSSFIKEQRINAIIKQVILVLLSVAFCVLFFVRAEFGIYYDLTTIVHGAGGVAGQFMGDVFSLVFSSRGITALVLFLLPAILFWPLLRERVVSCKRIKTPARIRVCISAVAAYLTALLLVTVSGAYGKVYNERYSFDTSIQNFGLLTGVRLDFVKSGDSSVSFATSDLDIADEHKDQSSLADPETYGVSSMDIDFEALAASTNNRNLRELDNYVASLTPSSKNSMTGRFKGYNLITICAEAFSAEVIDEEFTPTLYRMATKGIQFEDYYQFAGAGTQGGESQILFGFLCTEGADTMNNAPDRNNWTSLGNVFNRMGYNGWAFHNNYEDYYGRNITHNHLGFSNGFMALGGGMEEWVEPTWPESDYQMVQGTFDNIYGNTESEPFNVYYMSVSGHSIYTYSNHAIAWKNWEVVEDFDYSEPVKVYLAGNYELELAMEYLVQRLEETGLADNTVIVISADHFPYGLSDEATLGENYLPDLYGYSPESSFQRDHNRLIIWSKSLEDEDPIVVRTPVSSIDIMPTLCNLFGAEWDSRLYPGRDVFSDAPPVVFDRGYNWRSHLGTYFDGVFTPLGGIEVPDSYIETMNSIVANKINYCKGVLTNDYFTHVFGKEEDVQVVHDRGAEQYADLRGDA